ncbi:MAG: hypothetical protein ACQERG_07920 [Pseudomonadota bacterium]
MNAPRTAPAADRYTDTVIHHAMATPAPRGELPATWLADLACLPRLLLRGPGGAEWLADHGLEAPASVFAAVERPGGGLIARAGEAEWLVVGGRDETAFQYPGGDEPPVFTRSDFDYVVGGEAAGAVFAELCVLPPPTDPLRFTFTRMAGVNVWLKAMRGPDGPAWRVGGDPGAGAYLFEQLHTGVTAAGGDLVGVDDLFPDPGEQRHDP